MRKWLPGIAGVVLMLGLSAGMARATECPVPLQIIGGPGSGNGQFLNPFGVEVGPDGYLYVADQHNERVQVLTDDGDFILQLPVPAGANGYGYPTGIHVKNGVVWVSANQGQYVARWSTTGSFLGFAMAPPYGWYYPTGITSDDEGNVYVCDSGADRIVKLSPTGVYLGSWYSGGYGPYGIDFANGKLYVGHYYTHAVTVLKTDGSYLGSFGTFGDGPGQYYASEGITHDAAGNLYICDAGNDRIQKVTPSGSTICMFGGNGTGLGQLDAPSDIAIDAQGNLYVCEFVNNRIQKWTFGAVAAQKTTWGSIKTRYR